MSNIAPGQDLDLSFLNEIADGSNDFIVESIDMFLLHTPELLQIITTAVAAKEWTAAAQASHKLKPNLGFFGMPVCQGMIQEVELMAKAGGPDPQALMAKFTEVNELIATNIVSLKKIKAELESGS